MTERAAHLVDGVRPRVPGRQWGLTVPHRLRYLRAWNLPLCRAVLGVYARALLGFQRRQARRRGIRDGHAGSVTVIQRFGGDLNLNVQPPGHPHNPRAPRAPDRGLRPQPTPAPSGWPRCPRCRPACLTALLSACHAQMPHPRPWPVHLEARPILRRLPPRLPPSLVVNVSS